MTLNQGQFLILFIDYPNNLNHCDMQFVLLMVFYSTHSPILIKILSEIDLLKETSRSSEKELIKRERGLSSSA